MFYRCCSLIPLYSTWWRTACSTRSIGIKEREESKHLNASWMAEIVLKNNVFTFGKKLWNNKEEQQPELSLLLRIVYYLWLNWKRKSWREVELKPYLWWWYIDDIFFILEGTWRRKPIGILMCITRNSLL